MFSFLFLNGCIDGLNFSLFLLWIGHSSLLLDSENSHVIWFVQWDNITKETTPKHGDLKESLFYFSSVSQQFGLVSAGWFSSIFLGWVVLMHSSGGLIYRLICLQVLSWCHWSLFYVAFSPPEAAQRVSSHGAMTF